VSGHVKQTSGSEQHASGWFCCQRIGGAGQRVQVETFEEVNRLLLDFLSR
jgi:hypothetical protein